MPQKYRRRRGSSWRYQSKEALVREDSAFRGTEHERFLSSWFKTSSSRKHFCSPFSSFVEMADEKNEQDSWSESSFLFSQVNESMGGKYCRYPPSTFSLSKLEPLGSSKPNHDLTRSRSSWMCCLKTLSRRELAEDTNDSSDNIQHPDTSNSSRRKKRTLNSSFRRKLFLKYSTGSRPRTWDFLLRNPLVTSISWQPSRLWSQRVVVPQRSCKQPKP